MKSLDKVAVCSRSFSKNTVLRKELLNAYENVTFNDDGISLHGKSLIEFLKGHDKAIIGLEILDEYVLSRLPDLKVIGKYGVGLDKIDLVAMKRYGKRLGLVQGVNRRSVSELALSFMISLLRNVQISYDNILNGKWDQHIGRQLSGRTIGVIGCGNVGKDLVKLLQPFKCKILVNDIAEYLDFYKKYKLKPVEIEKLLQASEIVTLHLPYNDLTHNIICESRLSIMKPNAILINTARGGLVDEIALKKSLKEKKLAGAALDVFFCEPPSDLELLKLPNFFMTSHIGGSSEEAILAMGRGAIRGLEHNEIPSV